MNSTILLLSIREYINIQSHTTDCQNQGYYHFLHIDYFAIRFRWAAWIQFLEKQTDIQSDIPISLFCWNRIARDQQAPPQQQLKSSLKNTSCSRKNVSIGEILRYFVALSIGRVVVKVIGAVSWRDNNNLFIKFMVFSFIQLLEITWTLPTTCIWCNLHVLYMYSCSKSESDGAKMEIKFRRHTFRLPS